jgi:hypothetical protein
MEKVKREKLPLKGVHPKSQKIRTSLRGVHPKIQRREAPSGTVKYPNFVFNGGLAVNNPQVYIVFLGDWSSTTNQNRATRLSQFMTDLLSSEYMNILSQYGCGSSGNLVKSVFDANSNHDLMDSDIHDILQNAINNNVIPEPTANSVYIVYLDDDTGITDTDGVRFCEPTNDKAFGYHDFFTTTSGNPCYYAIVPGLTDACLKNTCPDDAKCSLHLAPTQTQEQHQTQVTSHEFSEMISDPQPPNGWYDPDPETGENGDLCNGHSGTITVGTNTWTVQLMYSKHDDMNGDEYCIVGSPNPITPL